MSPIYDLYCPKCDVTEEVICHESEKECFLCETCEAKMLCKPSKSNWKINGYKAKNNYE